MSDLFTSADAYDRFMGRFAVPLANAFVESLGLEGASRAGDDRASAVASAAPVSALDVGCGTGALTTVLASRLGPTNVFAVDPSAPLAAAAAERLPGVDVRQAGADRLPFDGGRFGATVAQLVINFVPDPVAAFAEMARVTAPGGVVAASVWDFAGHRDPLALFYRACRDLDPDAPIEDAAAGSAEGDLARLATAAGLVDVEPGELTVTLPLASFDEWWDPFTLGVGPAGAYLASLPPADRERLRDHARTLVAPGPFTVPAAAWTVRARPRR